MTLSRSVLAVGVGLLVLSGVGVNVLATLNQLALGLALALGSRLVETKCKS